jgi:methylated-DNA-[protein]-cysteine S-methyltransferase
MALTTFKIPTPHGPMRGAVTPNGLALVALPGSDWGAQLARLAKLHGPPKADESHLAAKELRAYIAGKLHAFSVPIDLELATPFARKVLTKLGHLPPGRVTTYGALARQVGRPKGARAVGGAVGSNPVPVVIPCHRVVATSGLGGFGGGLPMKRWLLRLEGLDPDALPR